MHRVMIALVVALVLATPSWALAQATPELSGTWRVNPAAGDAARLIFPTDLVITQSSTELIVERNSVRQGAISAVYSLDGSRVDVEAPSGITETAEASFDGASLVIASRRSFASPAGEIVVELRELWTVEGDVLTIEKTETQFGESRTGSAVYDKSDALVIR
jgi:hypothetical protein